MAGLRYLCSCMRFQSQPISFVDGGKMCKLMEVLWKHNAVLCTTAWAKVNVLSV
jgi:hypothetical protein